MYAADQADGPVRHAVKATTVSAPDSFEEKSPDLGSDMSVRTMKYCVAGTLGLLSPLYLLASSATSNWTINQIEIHEAVDQAASKRSASARDLAHVREVLKISVTELARVFGVTRQAVHEWAKGGALSPANAEKLSTLASAADALAESGVEMTPQLLRRKIGLSPSLLDSVTHGADVVDLARKLTDTLTRESQQRERLASRLAGRKKGAHAESEFAVPHFAEDA
jgi:DNA-binding transcriptional regulator YiaG